MKKISKQIKRCLAMVLTVAMLASYMTVMASAAETQTRLYNLVASIVTEDEANILTAGALKNNKAFSYVLPTPEEAKSLVSVDEDTLELTAEPLEYTYTLQGEPGSGVLYPSAYKVTYTDYSSDEFDYEEGVILPENALSVDVYYYFDPNEFFSEDQILNAMNLPVALKDDYDVQENAMDYLSHNAGAMKELDSESVEMVNALASFAPDTFPNIIKAMAILTDEEKGMYDGGCLTLCTMLEAYNEEGMVYYYQNYDDIIAQVSYLMEAMNYLAGDDGTQELVLMMERLYFGQFIAKIDSLKTKLGWDEETGEFTKLTGIVATLTAEEENLIPPHDYIDVNSGDLPFLVAALDAADANNVNAYDEAQGLMRSRVKATVDLEPMVCIYVDMTVGEENQLFGFVWEFEHEVTPEDIEWVKNTVEDWYEGQLNGKAAYYDNNGYDGTELEALIGQTLTEDVRFTYAWTPKNYTVWILGDRTEALGFTYGRNMGVTLPAYWGEGNYRYEYNVKGTTISTATGDKSCTFTETDLDNYFDADGVYTIICTKVDVDAENAEIKAEKLDNLVDSLNGTMGAGSVVVEDDTMTVSISADELMDFALGLYAFKDGSNGGYSYIGLNNEPLKDGTDISLQALVNAILNDASFDRDTVIDLGENGEGQLVQTTIQLDTDYVLDFVLNLTSVPDQMTAVSSLLKQAVNYVDFYSVPAPAVMALGAGEGGTAAKLAVELTLPDKVYEVYLAALLMTGNADLTDINDVSEAVAYEFAEDFINTLMGGDVTTTTYINTVKRLGYDASSYLEAYESYIDLLLEILRDEEDVVLTYDEEEGNYALAATISAEHLETILDSYAGLSGDLLNVIVEYRDGTGLTVPMTLTVTNFAEDYDYEALVFNTAKLQASGLREKLDVAKCVNDLAGELSQIQDGYTVVILQKDIEGNLEFNGTAILDLNGKTVNGDIQSNGNLYIIDRTMDTDDCGNVTGDVNGNVTVIAGNYAADVSDYLKAGYVQDGTTVHNKVYTIDADDTSVNFVIDTDTMTDWTDYDAKTLALDIVSDLLLNNYYSAAMDIVDEDDENYDVYGIYSVDFLYDLIGLYADGVSADTVNAALDTLYLRGIEKFINESLMPDLLDFETLAGTMGVTYTMDIYPWALNLDFDDDDGEEYMVVGVVPGDDYKSVELGIKLTGEYADELSDALKELGKINVKDETSVTVALDDYDLTYADSTIFAGMDADVVISLDMTEDTRYAVVIAGILANAGVKQEAFVEALNAFDGADTTAIRTAFNEVTVSDIIKALEKLNRSETFEAICTKLNVTNEKATVAKELEDAYHLFLCAAGKITEVLDITGPSVKMSNWCTEADGVYTYEKTVTTEERIVEQEIYSEYGLELTLGESSVTVKIALFKDVEEEDDKGGGSSGSSALDTTNHYSYMVGYADGTLKPYGKMTRGQAATIFFRLLTDEAREKYWSQTNDYSDCDASLWCNNAISTLSNMGIINGFADGTFRPSAYVTRAQFAKMAVGFFETTTKEYQGYFTDVLETETLSSYVEAAVEAGLVQGYGDGTFRPNAYITRAQACVIINRALGRVPHKDYLLSESKMITWSDCNPEEDWFYADMMEATNSHDYRWTRVGGEKIEKWTAKLEQRDWTALEHSWSTAHSAPGGEV